MLLKGNGVELRELLSTTIQQIYKQYGIRVNIPVLLNANLNQKKKKNLRRIYLKLS